MTVFIAADVPELGGACATAPPETRARSASGSSSPASSSSRRIASGTWCGTTTSNRRPQRSRRSWTASSRSQVPWRGHDPSPTRRLLDRVEDSRYALVIVAAERARPINNCHHQLGEGIGFDEGPRHPDRVPLEELPHDGDGRDRGRQDHVPRPTGLAGPTVARILLGVTGIAACKACTLVRLLVRAGRRASVVTAEPLDSSPRRPSSRSPGSRGARALPASRAGRPARRRAAHREHARAPRTAWRTTS